MISIVPHPDPHSRVAGGQEALQTHAGKGRPLKGNHQDVVHGEKGDPNVVAINSIARPHVTDLNIHETKYYIKNERSDMATWAVAKHAS